MLACCVLRVERISLEMIVAVFLIVVQEDSAHFLYTASKALIGSFDIN